MHVSQMNQLLMDGTHPEWLIQGQTFLIMKVEQNSGIPTNYQPITCLCTTQNFLSGIIVPKMNRHMAQYLNRF